MSQLRLDPAYAELDDICPGCGHFVLAGHPPSCPFYDLLDAITLELETEEMYREILETRTAPEICESLLTEAQIRQWCSICWSESFRIAAIARVTQIESR